MNSPHSDPLGAFHQVGAEGVTSPVTSLSHPVTRTGTRNLVTGLVTHLVTPHNPSSPYIFSPFVTSVTRNKQQSREAGIKGEYAPDTGVDNLLKVGCHLSHPQAQRTGKLSHYARKRCGRSIENHGLQTRWNVPKIHLPRNRRYARPTHPPTRRNRGLCRTESPGTKTQTHTKTTARPNHKTRNPRLCHRPPNTNPRNT